jgi:hypothetical protein
MKRRLLIAGLVLASAAAQADVLDFGYAGAPVCTASADGLGTTLGCNDLRYILQSYGDVAGVVDVNYLAPRIATSLVWGSSGYNDLNAVLWAEGGDNNSQARIEILPLNGGAVTLTHFDIGAFYFATGHTTVNVFEAGTSTLLYTFTGTVGAPPTHSSFDLNVSSSVGLWLEWQDSAYNVGIDNVTFTVGAVPEPATGAMLIAGLAACAAVARRRRG